MAFTHRIALGFRSANRRLSLALLLVLLPAVSAGAAGVVSWNKDVFGTITQTDTAGIVPVANWNNSYPAENLQNLYDSSGVVTTLDISPNAPFIHQIQSGDPGLDSDGSANKRLLNGYLNAGSTSTPSTSSIGLSQIPYSSYDLYVYFSADMAGRAGSVSVAGSTYDFNTVGAASLAGSNALFAEATSGTTFANAANYARFSRLSGSAQTLAVDIPDFGGIAGFQLVDRGFGLNTVNFSVNDPGESKSVPTWGIDAAFVDFDNVRQSIEHIGTSNVDAARALVYFDQPLVDLGGGNYALNQAAKNSVDNHLDLIAMAGTNLPLTLGTAGTFPNEIDPSYLQGGGVNVIQYARAIKATQDYINSKSGFTGSPILAIEAFNEPDYQLTYANPTELNSIITQLKTYSEFQNTLMVAPSTLNSDFAQGWYDQVPQATAGSSHLLAGSLTSWTNFIDNVNNSGNPFVSMELHSMGEILAGAERDMQIGMVWGDVLRGRGTLIRASDGDRLGYSEDLVNQSAAAVYRAPDGQVYAFVGALERDYTSTHSAFRFESEEPVYFNGIPVREYYLHAKPDEYPSAEDNDFVNYGSPSSEGSFATIDLDDSGIPALDGYRWQIVNVQDGSVMEVVGGGLTDGSEIRSATDDGDLNQLWRITRTRNGYYHLYNANSGKTAEVAGGSSLNNGQDVRQWGTADNSLQQWYIDEAGAGSFYLRNGFSNKYLDADLGSTNIFQWQLTGGSNQKWRFVLANPTDGPVAQYALQGDVNDSAGSNHAAAFGSPTYGAGGNGAIKLDGADDYVQLPSSVANSEDITIAAWVKWNGGAAWQRIFDFGNDTNEYMFLTPSSDEGRMHFGVTTSSDPGEYILETEALPEDEWVHLTLTLGGNTGILYVNGEPRVAGQILLDPTDFNPTNNFIGKSQWAQDPLFDGSIADFQVFDYALHMTQVAELIDQLPGDFNEDGVVDAADYSVWRNTLNATGLAPYTGADGDGDGSVTQADYEVWRSQFGQGGPSPPPGGGGGIPEPTGIAAMLLCGCLLLGSTEARHMTRKTNG